MGKSPDYQHRWWGTASFPGSSPTRPEWGRVGEDPGNEVGWSRGELTSCPKIFVQVKGKSSHANICFKKVYLNIVKE